MRTIVILNVSALLVLVTPSSSLAQDSTKVNGIDSIQNKAIYYTPYFSQKLSGSGNYIKVIDDPVLFRFSSGISVLNVLRGQIPGLIIPAYAPGATARIRSDFFGFMFKSALVIDGVSFNGRMGKYYNMNAFDFSSITSISNSNAMAFFNMQGNGSFLLTSKTGEGIKKPTFEFNSYETFFHRNRILQSSNSIAYSQDFGTIDARISYNYYQDKNPFSAPDEPIYHNLKINSGAKIGQKITTRLILNGQINNYESTRVFPPSPGPDTLVKKDRNRFFLANFLATYRPLSWLTVTSQIVTADRDSSHTREGTISWKVRREDNRQLYNLFASVSRKVRPNFQVTGFAGYQYDGQRQGQPPFESSGYGLSSIIVGITPQFSNLLETSLLYRLSRHKLFQLENQSKHNYNFSSAFVFSRLLNWEPLSFGKVRLSVGKSVKLDQFTYPIEVEYGFVPKQFYCFESGTDLAFLSSRILMSLTFFRNKLEPDLYPITPRLSKGWEAEVHASVWKRKNVSYQTGLTLSTFSAKFFPYPYADEGFTSPSLKINSFNRFVFRGLTIYLLIETFTDRFKYYPDLFIRSSYVKLRDISISYQVPGSLAAKMRIQAIQLSFAGRNLHVFSSSGLIFENFSHNPVKNFSLSLNVTI